jgi:uracil-DNA glycosylase family 4
MPKRVPEAATATFDAACQRCPRLVKFLRAQRTKFEGYHCAPVAPFGAAEPALLIVGLAPGLHGANRTGRPFTGDYAGVLLYQTLFDLGIASARESLHASDGLLLHGARITNAVKCVPPANKPTPAEARECNAYLVNELRELRTVRAILALGRIAHDSVLTALAMKRSAAIFGHGRAHRLPDGRWLVDSYHCSRYNTQTKRLTTEMFRDVVAAAMERADLEPRASVS